MKRTSIPNFPFSNFHSYLSAICFTQHLDYCPYISPDKKVFFFTSNRPVNKTPFAQQKNYQAVSGMLLGAGNGMDDVYWMKAEEF